MAISKKIIEENNQPSEGNAVVGGGGYRALNPSEFLDPNRVLSVDASGQSILDINNSLQNRFFRATSELLNRYPSAAAAYGLRSLKNTNSYVVKLRRASDNDERDFTAAELVGGVTGGELVVNGDFATDSDWAKGTGWSITGGQAVCDGSQVSFSYLSQDDIWDAETYYLMEFTIVSCSDFANAGTYGGVGSLRNFSSRYGITGAGTYKVLRRKLGAAGHFRFYAQAGVTLTIDNVSLKEHTPTAAELWAFNNQDIGISSKSSESACVTTWYDQSGSGNDATQTTLTKQPKLITAGVTEMENGKPAIVFDGVDDLLIVSTDISSSVSPHSLFAVSDLAYDTSAYLVRKLAGANAQCIFSGMNRLYNDGSSWRGAGGEVALGDQNLGVFILKSNDNDGYSNGVIVEDGSVGAGIALDGSDRDIGIGGGALGGGNITGDLQEIVIYPFDQSEKRVGIETNINDHYSIYQDGIIDLYTTPVAAYSLDSLARSHKSQPVIEARRLTSDTQDFNALQVADGTLESWAKEALLPAADHGSGASAAYSLRYISDNRPTDNNVVRVRRGSDSDERDFKPVEITNGDLQNWVNGYSLDAPADYDSGAAAAYSLRHVSDSYTGDVVKVVRSGDIAVSDFNPTEVTDGTLETWVRHLDGTQPVDFGTGAAAAYSLRNVASSMTASDPVVKLRRASDNAESDFTAAELVGGVTGPELITNVDFATDSGWSKGTGWTISGGQASYDGSAVGFSILNQDGILYPTLSAGDYAIVEFDVVSATDYGRCGFYIGSSQNVNFTSIQVTSTGTYRVLMKITTTNYDRVRFFCRDADTLTLDNISIKPYTPTAAELWAFVGYERVDASYGRVLSDSALVTTLYDQAASNEQVFGDPNIQSPADWTFGGISNVTNGLISIENATGGFTVRYNAGNLEPGTYRLEVDYYGVTQANRILIEGLLLPTGSGTASKIITVTSSNTLIVGGSGAWSGQTGYITGIRVINIGNPATQTTSTAQPKLITAGVTEMENGKPALVFDGNVSIGVAGTALSTARHDSFFVMQSSKNNFVTYAQVDSSGGGNMWSAKDGDASTITTYQSGSPTLFVDGDQPPQTTADDLHTALGTGSQLLSTTIGADTSGWKDLNIGEFPNWPLFGGSDFIGNVQEFIIYDSDQSTNRTDIEAGIMGYYGINGYGEGSVVTWYDQSGNGNNATQGGGADRPKIVTNGDIVVKDGKPAVMFDFNTNLVLTAFPVSNLDTFAIFNVYTLTDDNSVDNGYGPWSLGSSTNSARLYASRILNGREYLAYGNSQTAITLGFIEKDQKIMRSYVTDGVNVNLRKNGDNLQTIAVQSNANVEQFKRLGYWPALVQEAIIYNSDQSANRGQVESNMNAYYNVYSQSEVDDGFVTTWYDQSGNDNHATQTTATQQPKIVSDGVLVQDNGKPAMVFDGVDDVLENSLSGGDIASPLTIAAVFNKNVGAGSHVFDGDTLDRNSLYLNAAGAGTRLYNDGAGIVATSAVTADQVLVYAVSNGASSSINENGNTPVTGTIGTLALDGITIGRAGSSFNWFDSAIQEIIIYPSNQSANREVIEYNINNYYSIYSAPSGMADAYVSKWYDQVGSNDMAETDVTKQPKIVIDGTLFKDSNNRPAMQLVINDGLVAASAIGTTADYDDFFSSDQGSDFFNSSYSSSYNYRAYPGDNNNLTNNMYNIRHRIVWNEGVLSTSDKTAIENLIDAQVSFSGLTDWSGKFRSWSKLKEMPLVDSSDATSMSSTWRDCSSLVVFPVIDTSKVTTFLRAWRNTDIVTFPSLDFSSATTFNQTWMLCGNLENFPANMFDSCTATDFTDAFNGTNLSQTSIDNILVSIDAAGQTNGTFSQSGGSAPSDVGEAAIYNLIAKGWTVTATGGPFYGASAVYSLREANGDDAANVVRLRRASDSAEQDFTAADLVGSVEGGELITNGDFATDSDWSKGAGWTISGGQASCNNTFGSNKKLGQAISEFTAGGYFKMTFTIVAFSSNTGSGLRASQTTERGWSNYGITTTGTYTVILDADIRQLSDFQFWCGDGETLTIDNVSVKPYTPTVAELWVLETLTSGTEPWADQLTDSAYVTTWYDQSGNGNDASAPASAQPKLITAGVTELENGKLAMVFDGTDDYLDLADVEFSATLNNLSAFTVTKTNNTSANQIGLVASSVRRFYVPRLLGDDELTASYTADASLRDGPYDTSQHLVSLVCDQSNSVVRAFNNGAAFTDAPTNTIRSRTTVNTSNSIGSLGTTGFFWDGTIQEVVVYDSDKSTNRIGIETNINNHYNIY